jgi:SprT protein
MALKPEVQILSPELRKRIEDKVRSCLDIAAKEYKRDFEMPVIRYDVRNTDGGLAYHQLWLIRLNLILCYENEKHFIDTTVPHEVAHLVARAVYNDRVLAETGKRMRPHGKEWKEVMSLFELEAKVTHQYSVASIERKPRRPRGSKLRGKEADVLIHRLTTAGKRLPKRHLDALIRNLNALRLELA